MAQRDDDEENGYQSNVRYNPDHCLLDHDAVFGMIENDMTDERMNSMENFELNPRDDIPGPISFLLRGSNSFGNNNLTHHTLTQQQQQLTNAKKQRKPTLHEMENWKEMKSIVEQRGQTKFLTSLEKIQNNRATTSKEKIPLLPVIVRQILHYDSNESAHVLFGELESDIEIEGTISKKAIEKNTSILTVGTVVLLKKVQIYCPKPLKFHLIISEKNTAKVWVSENEENSVMDNRTPRPERISDEFTFDRNIESLDEFTPTRILNRQQEEENEVLSSQPVITKQQTPQQQINTPSTRFTPQDVQLPPPTTSTGRTAFIKPKAPIFSTPQQQNNPFSSKYKPVETPQINIDDGEDGNLELSQPLITPRSYYAASPEVVSTNKRKVDSISSQNSLNDSGGKRRKSPLDEESALLRDSFNDPLFDDSSNHSLSIPDSPPILQDAPLENPKNVIVPPFTPLSNIPTTNNSGSMSSINLSGISNISQRSNSGILPSNNSTFSATNRNNTTVQPSLASNNSKQNVSAPPKKTVLFDDDEEDPLMGIMDDDLFPSNNSNTSVKSSLSSNDNISGTSSTSRITKPPQQPGTLTNKPPLPTSASNFQSSLSNKQQPQSTTSFKPPQVHQQSIRNPQTFKPVGAGAAFNKNNVPPQQATQRKQLVEDDDESDPLQDILDDSLFNDAPPVAVNKYSTPSPQPQQQPKKKTIQYDDDF